MSKPASCLVAVLDAPTISLSLYSLISGDSRYAALRLACTVWTFSGATHNLTAVPLTIWHECGMKYLRKFEGRSECNQRCQDGNRRRSCALKTGFQARY
jgi:hypothetical protein